MMVERGGRCRGAAQQETIKGEMVVALPDPGRHLPGIGAAVAVAVEVTEREGIGQGARDGASIQQRAGPLADIRQNRRSPTTNGTAIAIAITPNVPAMTRYGTTR